MIVYFSFQFPKLPEAAVKKLSKDQQDFYFLCWSVIIGECRPEISNRQLGKCSQVRWLTPGSSVLRVYISEVE